MLGSNDRLENQRPPLTMIATFLMVMLITVLFVSGTVLIVRALGAGNEGNYTTAGLYAVVGLALKFPALIVGLNIAKVAPRNERTVAMIAIVLVYFLTVAGASMYGRHQNREEQ